MIHHHLGMLRGYLVTYIELHVLLGADGTSVLVFMWGI